MESTEEIYDGDLFWGLITSRLFQKREKNASINIIDLVDYIILVYLLKLSSYLLKYALYFMFFLI